MTKTPEQWLEQAAPEKKAGIFKLFLGYAPGVGKTYGMLSEAIRRKSRGEDVVIGVIESHGRKATGELARVTRDLSTEVFPSISQNRRLAYSSDRLGTREPGEGAEVIRLVDE